MIWYFLIANLVVFGLTLLNNQVRVTLFAGKSASDAILIVALATLIAIPLLFGSIVRKIVKKVRK